MRTAPVVVQRSGAAWNVRRVHAEEVVLVLVVRGVRDAGGRGAALGFDNPISQEHSGDDQITLQISIGHVMVNQIPD